MSDQRNDVVTFSGAPVRASILSVMLFSALALSACSDDARTLAAQADREARRPYAVLTDNHGCKWRVVFDDSRLPYWYPQLSPDGTIDCHPPKVDAKPPSEDPSRAD